MVVDTTFTVCKGEGGGEMIGCGFKSSKTLNNIETLNGFWCWLKCFGAMRSQLNAKRWSDAGS